MAATATAIRDAIERQHPDAGVLVLDARGGEGEPHKLAYRERDDEAAEDVMDMVVMLNALPREDPRTRR